MDSHEYCSATLNYIGGAQTVSIEVPINNARMKADLSWQKHGFQLLRHDSAVTDWDNRAGVTSVHYDEIATLAKSLTGCDAALVAGHISRNPEQVGVHEDYAPIQFVHSDFTDNYGQLVKERYLSADEESARALESEGLQAADVVRAKRMIILQLWRNVGAPEMDLPLAFCDAQTVPRSDIHAIHVPNYAGGDFAFDAFGVTPAPSSSPHSWYVFPSMRSNEVVAFRTYDSDMVASGEAYWTPHSAFQDPTVDANAPRRRSIELRATCLFF